MDLKACRKRCRDGTWRDGALLAKQHVLPSKPVQRKGNAMSKALVCAQFGANAAAYVTSAVHARGNSLTRLVELVQPQPHWQALDIATAAGHTAFTFAPHVAHVWATNITPEMLETVKQQATERNLKNVTVEYADAEDLPYPDASFDLVTCRIAPHHFPNVDLFCVNQLGCYGPRVSWP